MKKTQKRLGNKGFSLVELIVVIAIMAVLVGVLAPTLIRNVEKSRESKDAQNIDSIKNAIEVTLQNEDAYQEAITKGDVITFNDSNEAVIATTGLPSFTSEFNSTLDLSKSTLTSKEYKGKRANIKFTVSSTGTVTVSGLN